MMATFNPPKLLLLDEHTAALDPGTAEKVLELTLKIVKKDSITCMMITHNMQSAIDMGNRLLMMNHGRLILDTEGSSKSALTVSALVEMFRLKAGRALQTDRMLLSERD